MTWNFIVGGTRERVKARVQMLERVPEPLRSAMCAAIDALHPSNLAITVESAGHLDGTGGSVKFNVRTQRVFIEL